MSTHNRFFLSRSGPESFRARGPLIASLVAGAGLLMAACGPGASASGNAGSSSAGSAKNVATTKTTITLFSSAGLKPFESGLASAFHSKYPAITVKLDVVPDNTYNTVLPRLLDAGNPPDIAAPADLIANAKDGLLANLNGYAKQYGWTSKIPSSVLAQGRVSSSGVIGSGTLYEAGGSAGPFVGVWYNRSLAAKVGITTVPTTLGQLQSDLAKAKAAGVTPIIASNGDGLIGHLYSLLLGDYMGPNALNAIVDNSPGAKLDTSAAVQATSVLSSWMQKGYFNSDANAIDQEASYGDFSSGQGLFMFQGSWMLQSLPPSFTPKMGVFPFPPLAKGDPYSAMLSNGLFFSIAQRSAHKAAAALFLNFLTTPAAAKVAIQNGYAAVNGNLTNVPQVTLSQPLSEQIQYGYEQVAKDNGFTNWLQNAAAPINTAETQQLQLLFANKTTPSAMVSSLQSTYSSALASNG